ncbi:MAG: TRAP transporter small permease [Pseudomonadota bacterium]|nr:TRAP transporter small permease [Burkholderiaceae bacterium]MDQ3447475.1 TRAP transporter small permease [Pseudomonadota bacterium]
MNRPEDAASSGGRRFTNRIGQFVRVIDGAAMAVSALGILISLALIGWSIVMRYLFNSPPVWVDEVVGFMLVGIVMLAAAQVLRNGEHIGVDLFTTHLGERGKLWAQVWASLSVLAVSLIFVANGWETAMFSRSLGIVTEGHLEIPVYSLMLFLPLGGVLMLLTAIEALLRLAFGAPSLATRASIPEDAE